MQSVTENDTVAIQILKLHKIV